MDKHQRWEHFIDVMEQQICLFDEFASAVNKLRDALHSHDWTSLEKSFSLLDEMSTSIEAMENERFQISRELCDGGEMNQNSLESSIAGLQPELRSRFLDVRSRLRARIVSVSSRIHALAAYAASRSRLGKDLMEELVPSARGRTYNRQGVSRQGESNPLILSRHL